MIYLLNSFPNSLQPKPGAKITIEGITTTEAIEKITGDLVLSRIGHASVAALIESLAYKYYPTTPDGDSYKFEIPVCREPVSPEQGDILICCLSTPPRRLAEGEKWTEAEIQEMPSKWVVVYY